ncbi:hypothetical protein DFS33DRAFT_584705 [Desarmillaria ectypa]|nr:hypothetical protein DFS33DRAFT_584705 [Desarmillaria ectypa]
MATYLLVISLIHSDLHRCDATDNVHKGRFAEPVCVPGTFCIHDPKLYHNTCERPSAQVPALYHGAVWGKSRKSEDSREMVRCRGICQLCDVTTRPFHRTDSKMPASVPSQLHLYPLTAALCNRCPLSEFFTNGLFSTLSSVVIFTVPVL